MSFDTEWAHSYARERSEEALELASRRRLLVALRRQRRAERAARRARTAWLAVPGGTQPSPVQRPTQRVPLRIVG